MSGFAYRRGFKTAISLLGAAALLVVLSPVSSVAHAACPTGELTQGEYLRLLVKASAPKAAVPVGAPTSELVKWAAARGVMPSGGWKLEAQLTREVYAQTLAQLYGLTSEKDPFRALKQEGVVVPASRLIERTTVTQAFNDFGFQSQAAKASRNPATPIRPEPGDVICHKGNTIVVAHSAERAHLAHGDGLGICVSSDRGKNEKQGQGEQAKDEHDRNKP